MAEFIVFEGIDGSGKGTQVELVAERLRKFGKKVALLDFPRYGQPSAIFVERHLNGVYGELSSVSAKQASTFYALDRFDAKAEIEAAIRDNDYVLSNRYVSASMVHQAAKIEEADERNAYLDWVDDFEYNIMGIPRPDRVFFLKISPETSVRLIATKLQREYISNGSNKDIYEADTDHLRKAAEWALHTAARFHNWTIIECEEAGEMLTRELITERILSLV